ncbi:MAG: Mrp/NBP35 family ATP-binding protein [Lachnospiraceae bacterium]|nr:Mrp/NBP35 family ATP-binding protein [Lachnospiraceae bacterium]
MSEPYENCTHDCGSCGASCSQRDPGSMIQAPHPDSHIRKVIGIVSGKGGVGKSLVTALSAVSATRMGYSAGILDADITGPSIPKMFGIHEKAFGTEDGLLPVETRTGIKLMSINLILDNESDPVAWRGPILSGVVTQFWSEVIWGDVDYLFVDMPPGTGDVMLTVFQSLPIDGIIIVTSPQDLVRMIVEKAVNMAAKMDVPILGVIENMSYAICPDCGKKLPLFGESRLKEIADRFGLDVLGQIPILPEISNASDDGTIEEYSGDYLDDLSICLKKVMDQKAD